MVSVSASVNLPLHHKVQRFSSATGSPGWSRKKGRKTVVVWWLGSRSSVLWHCWLGGRKGIWPVKLSGEVLTWLSLWSKVQMICIWCCWCHCHLIISCASKIQNGLPFWCCLNQVVLEKRPLNGCSSSSRKYCTVIVMIVITTTWVFMVLLA